MMIGFGYCVKKIRRGRYLYFWHYETHDGGRKQVEEYVGPEGDAVARQEICRRIALYEDRAKVQMSRFVHQTEVKMATRA